MDQITQTVSSQVFIMFALIVTGYILYKCKVISKKGAQDMSNVLLTIVTPCVLINAYQTKLDRESLLTLGVAFAVSIIIHIIMIFVSKLYFFRVKNDEIKKINIAGSMFSNCGFMAVPLLTAVFGSKGVFYGSAYLAVFNCFAWTYGITLYSGGKEKFTLKKMLLNPGIIGTAIAMLLYFLQIRLPLLAGRVVGYVADLNTPLAMILLGSFLARSELIKTLKNINIYAVTFLRLVIFPLITILLLAVAGADKTMSISVLIGASCPTAAIVALFAEKYDMDSSYGSQISSFTTLVSLVTIPLIVHLASIFIK